MSYHDGNYQTVQFHGMPRNAFAFEQETNTVILEQDCWQNSANFAATALGTAHPNYNTMYLVHESPRQPIGAGVVQWTRFYCHIPETRSEYESHALKLPGLGGNEATVIRPIAGNAANANANFVNLNILGHGYAVNDGITIEYHTIQSGTPTLSFTRQVFRTVANVINANYVVVGVVTDFNTVVFHAAWNHGTKRQPRSEKVNSRLQFDYYLPNVTGGITTPNDIPILSPTPILDSVGNEIDTYSDSTSPTQANYLANIVGTEVVVEESILHVWRGTIYERQTRYAEAR